MESLFDVVVSEPVTLDTDSDRSVFTAWVRGLSARDVVQQRLVDFQAEVEASSVRMGKGRAVSGLQLSFRRRGSTAEETPQEEALSQRSQLEALFTKDTVDAYRVFDTIEHFLCQPEYFRGQIQVQLGYATQAWMVERYHELDDAVLREIIGKRVTTKTRKDLDDVSELTRVPLRSCRRQYDNIRRILSIFEDSPMLQQISVAREIRDRMSLPLWLAAKYTASIFLLHLRFQIQGSRRPTAHMTADDLCWSAMGILNDWVGTGVALGAYEDAGAKVLEEAEPGEGGVLDESRKKDFERAMEEGLLESRGLELDKKWIRMLRTIKSRLSGDSRYSLMDPLYQHALEELQRLGQKQETMEACSTHFKSTVRALASIASGLALSKEYRAVFDDLIEKVGNPLRDAGVGLDGVWYLLEALVRGFARACARSGSTDSGDEEMVDAWKRYIFGVRIFFRYAYRNSRPTSSTARARAG